MHNIYRYSTYICVFFLFVCLFVFFHVHMGSSMMYVLVLRLNAQDCQFDRGTTAAHL